MALVRAGERSHGSEVDSPDKIDHCPSNLSQHLLEGRPNQIRDTPRSITSMAFKRRSKLVELIINSQVQGLSCYLRSGRAKCAFHVFTYEDTMLRKDRV